MTALLDCTVALDQIGKSPLRLKLVADQNEEPILQERLGVLAVADLSASCALTPMKNRNGYFLEGEVSARITQQCIATLDDVEEQIQESFLVQFVEQSAHEEEEDVDIEPDDVDIEYYTGDQINISEVLVQYLALAIDPYPRKKTLSEEEVKLYSRMQEEAEAAEQEANPFNVLKKLQDKT